MLKNYDLDRQSVLDEETKRIEDITNKTVKFFEDYHIEDEDIQFRFLTNMLKLDYDRVKSMLTDRKDFDKILLFLSINHPNQYPEHLSSEDFCKSYEIKPSKLEYYIDEIIDNNLYEIKFFKLKVSFNASYYFQEGETLEIILRAITEKHIKKFTYLNQLFSRSFDLGMLEDRILDDVCGKIINNDLKEPLREFLSEYIRYLAYKVEKKLELKNAYDKLDAIIWQNMTDIFLTRESKDLEYQFLGQCDQNYQLDSGILTILKSYYQGKYQSNIKAIEDLIEEKEYNNALKMVNSSLKSDKKNNTLIILKASILCYLNRFKDVNDFIDNVLKTYENLESENEILAIYFLKVFSSLSGGNFKNAKDITERIIKKYPEHPLSYAIKGLVFGYNRIYKFDLDIIELSDGLSELDTAIDLDPDDVNKSYYYQLKSQILLEINKFEEAMEVIDKAIVLNSRNIDLYHSKSNILIYFNQYSELLKFLDIMNDLFPEIEKEIKMKKASIYRELGDFATAFEHIDEILKKHPGNSTALNYKAYLYQYIGKEEEAIELIEQLIEREPNNGIYYDSYGEILMYYEEYESAAEKFQKAIELSNYGWFLYQMYIKLGICFKELGNKKLAIENLKKGKKYTNKCFCDFETKRKWLTIADLFITESESYA